MGKKRAQALWGRTDTKADTRAADSSVRWYHGTSARSALSNAVPWVNNPQPPAIHRHPCATMKHTTTPMPSGSSVASVVHFTLPVSL